MITKIIKKKITVKLTPGLTFNQQATNKQLTTNNNDNNIYNYFINKYKSNEKNTYKQIKILGEMRRDEKWDDLTWDEQLNLQTAIFGDDIL